MARLFECAAVCTDMHFGRKNNDKAHNIDCLNFLEWFIDKAKEYKADCIIFCGDYFDSRHSIQISTLHYGMEGLEKLDAVGVPIYVLLGNHDLAYKEKRTLSSVMIAKKYENIKVFYDIQTLDGVTFCPWLVNDEWKAISQLAKQSTYIFGHFELPTFMMNAMVEMPEHDGLTFRDFDEVGQWAFTGHFHKKQSKGKVVYLGNTFPHNFSDAWDDDRGMMILNWEQTPQFFSWPSAPSYKTLQLSELLDNADGFLNDRVYARVTTDLPINHTQSQTIRDILLAHYSPRRLEIVDAQKGEDALDFDEQPIYKTVDQIVIEGLNSVDSSHLDKKLLVEIYLGL
jgi:DNA repair exonuclease SbcCD nuclease subunit